MFLRISALAAVVVLGVGCVAGDVDEPRVGAVQQDIGGCDEFMCGTNSPVIAEFGFWELNLPEALGTLGLANNVGMQVLGFVQNNALYLPRVLRGKLTASNGVTTLSGSALVGGYFYLKNGSRTFELKVSAVGSVDSWAQPASGTPHVTLETYQLDWAEFFGSPPERFQNMCPNPPSKDNPDSLTMVGSTAFQTLLFEGDRINAAHKVDTSVDRSWFNLGCAGSALAKMALTGHTQGAWDAGTFSTTLAERTTMLKMLAADYCGDGTAFTVGGQPLNWEDDHGTMKLISAPANLVRESRWKETGAVCLDKPRVDVHPTANSIAQFGSMVTVYQQVQDHCQQTIQTKLPACDGGAFDLAGHHLLSATPL
jgi:hypothetical protein